jgi:hypothetical protein
MTSRSINCKRKYSVGKGNSTGQQSNQLQLNVLSRKLKKGYSDGQQSNQL